MPLDAKKVFVVTDQNSPTHSDASSENETTLLIDPLEVHDLVQHSPWLSTLVTTLGNITCKLDTGAEANVLPVSDYNKLLNRPPLKSTDIKLTAYGGSSINPIGTCILQCSSKDKSHDVKFYVVTVDSQPILGLKDCEKLGLVKRVDTVETGQLQACFHRVRQPRKISHYTERKLHTSSQPTETRPRLLEGTAATSY